MWTTVAALGVAVAICAATLAPGAVVKALPSWPPWPGEQVALPTSGQSPQGDSCPQGSGDTGRPDATAMATSYPDGFGYTWDDSVPFAWVNAASGMDTGLDRYSTVAGPFPIGFAFRFYDNVYTQFWVSKYGLLGFNPDIGYA
jgi:hypothetical protein